MDPVYNPSPPTAVTPDSNGVPAAPTFQASSAPTPPIPAFQAIEEPTPMPTPTSTAGSQPPMPQASDAPANVVSGSSGDSSKKKKILASLGVVLMILGIGAGVFAVRSQQLSTSSAWDCSLYTFSLSDNGTVTVANGSSRDEPEQQAQVYINSNLVDTFNVPALTSGEGATLGTVSLPTNQSYTWRIDGTRDCDNSGSKTVNEVSASCSAVVAYDEDWAQLTSGELSQLSEGDVVRFAVSGTATAGTIDKARFSINGGTAIEVTDVRPGSNDFYYEYTVPTGVTSFNVTAEVFHSSLGWF